MSAQFSELYEVVEKAFNNALANPTIERWKSASVVAGCAAVNYAHRGEFFRAASLEGVAEEARRHYLDMQKVRVAA